jgi:hypothetical protein
VSENDVGADIARIGPARLAKAITAPSGIVTFGAVTAVSILGLGASLPAIAGAAVIGGVAWLGSTVFRIRKASRRSDAAAGRIPSSEQARIDPFTVGEPWRRFVGSALRHRNRYAEIVAATRPGPIRDRLASIGSRVDGFVDDVWDIANRGDTLHSGLRRLDAAAMQRDLDVAKHELATAAPERQARLREIVDSREASMESARRLSATTQDALDRLRELDAKLDRLIVNAVEVSATASSADDLDDLDREFEYVVTEMDGLREAINETDRIEEDPARAAYRATQGQAQPQYPQQTQSQPQTGTTSTG